MTPPSNESPSGRQRTLDFLAGKPVDRPPFHPIIMRWAAKYAGVKYRDFCLDPPSKCRAMIRCADDFEADWVTVLSDPYAEAEAFGIKVDYQEDDLPLDQGHFSSVESLMDLKPYDVMSHRRTAGRIAEIRGFREQIGDRYFVVGWVEGPVAEYADLRGMTEAALDFMDEPEKVGEVMDMITEAAKQFITLQIEAGADCIGIGDAFGSQIGPILFRKLAFTREKALVDHIHRLGAKAKLHICGNTSAILPDMIATGADIIDVDHLVPSFQPFVPLLAPHQVFCGKADPVSVLQNGSRDQIGSAVRHDFQQAGGRCITSGGCEITPGTSLENMHAFRQAGADPAT
ncbi:MAG: uroporphyrinogen decarboxylase family protein [Akkermansiaceae bacterium]|nr:uroporphyrinogen decarboxylase family protein [Akkermansiaceae bacterium]